jgi:hypothetical protein
MQEMKLKLHHQYGAHKLVSLGQHFDVKPTRMRGVVFVPDLIFTPQLRRF